MAKLTWLEPLLRSIMVGEHQRPNQWNPSAVSDYIIRLHASPKARAYHNLNHVKHVIQVVNELTNVYAVDIVPLTYAALFHDCIYDTQWKYAISVEAASANVWNAQARLMSVSEEMIRLVVGLILCTRTHKAYTLPQEVFIDADMAILGSSLSEYDVYRKQIREEWSHIPDDKYAAGRSNFLRETLASDRIFHTQYMFDTYEEIARMNLAYELKFI